MNSLDAPSRGFQQDIIRTNARIEMKVLKAFGRVFNLQV